MPTTDMVYFDVNDQIVPPALAEKYAVKAVQTIRDGPRILSKTTFNSTETKPPMPLVDEEE